MAEFKPLDHLITKLTQDLKSKGTPNASITRLQDCIRFNIQPPPSPKDNPLHLTAQHALQRPLTPKETDDLAILSWLVEIFYASFRVGDDLLSSSSSSDTAPAPAPQTKTKTKTKTKTPCWHHRPDIGFTAINDACLLKTSVMILLRIEMRSHPAYVAFLDLFGEARYHVELNVLGASTSSSWGVERNKEGGERWSSEINKQAFCRAYLPVALALEYTGSGGGGESSASEGGGEEVGLSRERFSACMELSRVVFGNGF